MALVCCRTIFRKNFLSIRWITMSAQLRAEEAVEDLKNKNPYFEKYAAKLAALQQTSPEEFVGRMEKLAEKRIPKSTEKNRSYAEILNPKPILNQEDKAKTEAKLSDIMKIDLIQDKSAEEIKNLWLEYHKNKDVIAASIPIGQYDELVKRGKEHPIFLFPLPRSEGFEFIMLQFAGNIIHFTPLLCYQVHKENAPECLSIVHYTELRNKGIILMRGEFDTKVLNAQEAQCLANQLQLYYVKGNQGKLELLKKFTSHPDSFKHMDLIKEMENIKLT